MAQMVTKENAQQALDDYLKQNHLVEATQQQLNEWYDVLIKDSNPMSCPKAGDWKDQYSFLEKEIYVHGNGIKNLPSWKTGTIACFLRVTFGEYHPTLEVYNE